jgi:peptide/nickel transport system ATP-binding protein
MGLTAADIEHGYGGQVVLDGVSVSLAPGEVIGLGGVSGGGKTTFARILAGLDAPSKGHVFLDGLPLPPFGKGASGVQYAPQSAALACDPRWRVRDVLGNGGPPDATVLDALKISPHWADRFPHELSGGELARVSLARLLGPATRFLICDEVTAQLDALAQARLWPLLLRLTRARRMGLVVISHDARLRGQICDRNFLLVGGRLHPEGRDKRPAISAVDLRHSA